MAPRGLSRAFAAVALCCFALQAFVRRRFRSCGERSLDLPHTRRSVPGACSSTNGQQKVPTRDQDGGESSLCSGNSAVSNTRRASGHRTSTSPFLSRSCGSTAAPRIRPPECPCGSLSPSLPQARAPPALITATGGAAAAVATCRWRAGGPRRPGGRSPAPPPPSLAGGARLAAARRRRPRGPWATP